MRQQKKLSIGNHNAQLLSLVRTPKGSRLRFLVLDDKLKDTECIATLKVYSDREISKLFGGKPIESMMNSHWEVIVQKNTYNPLLTITGAKLKKFIVPKWFIEHQEEWQGCKNGEKNSKIKEEYLKKREERDPKFYVTARLREIQDKGIKGEYSDVECIKLFGIDHKGLRAHIEGTFKGNMNWSNRGRVWHLDHIKPFVSFDLTQKSECLKAIHYTNLQALTVEENLEKYSN